MKAFKTFLLSLVAFGLCIVILSWSILSTITTASNLNNIFKSSGLYEYSAARSKETVISAQAVPEQYRQVVIQAINQAITASQLEAVTKPLLVDIVGWLDQPAGTPPPKLIVNIAPIKSEIIKSLSAADISQIERAALTAQVGKLVPDQLNLDEAQGLAGAVTSAAVSGSDEAPATEQTSVIDSGLIQVKSAVIASRFMVGVGLVLVIIGLFALIFLSRRDGRAVLRRPAWSCIIAAILMGLFTVVTFLLPAGAPLSAQSSPMTAIIAPSLREIGLTMRWYVLITVLVGLALYGFSYLFARQPSVSDRSALRFPKS